MGAGSNGRILLQKMQMFQQLNKLGKPDLNQSQGKKLVSQRESLILRRELGMEPSCLEEDMLMQSSLLQRGL